MVHRYNETQLSHKKNKLVHLLMTSDNIDAIRIMIFSEVKSEREETPYDISYLWNLT